MNILDRPEVRVSHRNLRWEVSLNGHTRRMIDWLCSKERAVDHAVERALEVSRREGIAALVVIEGADGVTERELLVDAKEEADARPFAAVPRFA